MKKSTRYKILSFFALGILLIGYNQCVSPLSTPTKSAIKFSSSKDGVNAAAGNSTPTFSSAEVKAISIEAFKTTLYTVTRTKCVACHGVNQTPLHAVADVASAHDSIVDTFKIDFNNIPNSRMITKLRVTKHNCWGDCLANADEIERQIIEWKRLIDSKAPTATDATPNVPGKVTAETETVEEILNPKNLIDQGTLTLMAESGSLKTPMVKVASTTSYIWAPKGTGLKTLTSADAGLAFINFKLTNSDFYKIYMLVDAPDTSSDSIYVKVAGGDTKEWHLKTPTKGFEWREVTHTTSFLDSPFYIAGGVNFGVELRQRDDGFKISKITITNDSAFNPSMMKALKSTITLPLVSLSGISNSFLDIDIEDFDMYSYKITNPRIRTPQDLFIKSLKVLVNGVFNPQHATYLAVDKKVTPLDGSLSNFSMILLKDKGIAYDRLSFSFDYIGSNTPPVIITPPAIPAPPVVAPPVTPVPVVKLSSVAGFQQTLWGITRARCASCHAVDQSPQHAAADVNVAHTNVIEGALVNFTNVSNSKITLKLKNLKHHCWSDCTANALEMEGQITIWKNLSGK